MKYFAVFLPMLDPEKSATYRQEHLDYLAKLNAEGKVFAYGRFTDGAGGLIIYRTETEEEARALAQNDPYVVHKARGCEFHEWDMKSNAIAQP
jgi:hypothetical protein